MPIPLQLLDSFQVMSALTQEQRLELCSEGREIILPKRAVVVDKGVLPAGFYLLLEGRVQGTDFTIDGREVGIYVVDQGEFFGEMSLIDDQPSTEMLICATKCRVVELPRILTRDILFSRPQSALALTQRVTQRLRKLTEQRKILSLNSPLQRVCSQIMTLGKPSTEPDAEMVVNGAPTHQELAMMINASRETVTRIFQVLQAENVLVKQGNTLKVFKLMRLKELAETGKPNDK